jgi:hypothetical protein
VLNPNRYPPVFHPVQRGEHVYFNLAMSTSDPRFNDVGSDEAIMIYSQYSTHWDTFAHKGTVFDADGDGVAEKVSYNGYQLVDAAGKGLHGSVYARSADMAVCKAVQHYRSVPSSRTSARSSPTRCWKAMRRRGQCGRDIVAFIPAWAH